MVITDGIRAHDKRKRREPPTGIVIHHTGVGGRKVISDKLWARLYKNITAYLGKDDKNYVSAHFTIGHNGECTRLVNPATHEAWHSGRSTHWDGHHRRVRTNLNRTHIGIELIGDGNIHEYTEAQYQTLATLCAKLTRQFKTIHPLNIVGHEQISPGRKDDPGKHFNWWRLFRLMYVR